MLHDGFIFIYEFEVKTSQDRQIYKSAYVHDHLVICLNHHSITSLHLLLIAKAFCNSSSSELTIFTVDIFTLTSFKYIHHEVLRHLRSLGFCRLCLGHAPCHHGPDQGL